MIVANIEIWPLGSEEDRRRHCTIVIANDGTGDAQGANYSFTISHQEETRWAVPGVTPHQLLKGEGAYRAGKVLGLRRTIGVVRLLHACLKEAFS